MSLNMKSWGIMKKEEPASLVNPGELVTSVNTMVDSIGDVSVKVTRVVEKAKVAKRKAVDAKGKKSGWSFLGTNKQEAIIALQDAAVEQADALSEMSEASEVMFKAIKDLSVATRSLLVLGLSNSANTRLVIKQITNRLSVASEAELNQYARDELKQVVRDLKAQEDMFNRIDKLSERCKALEVKVQNQSEELKTIRTLAVDMNVDVVRKRNKWLVFVLSLLFIAFVLQIVSMLHLHGLLNWLPCF